MEILKPTNENIRFLGNELKKGKLVAFPTDTVYGMGAVVDNEEAIKKIYKVKNRPLESPVIILIGDKKDLEKIVDLHGEKVIKLVEAFWPGGLTLVLNKKKSVSGLLSAGGRTIGVRMPDNEIACELIKNSGGALATPSANKTGQLTATNSIHVRNSFEDGEIDYLIDGGTTHKGMESTILDMTLEQPLIIRNGVVTKQELEKVIGFVDELKNKKKSERSFGKKIILVDKNKISSLNKEYVYLAFKKSNKKMGFFKTEVLSDSGDYDEAIKNFYDCLHSLNETKSPVIYIEQIEEIGSGKLLMERIKKIITSDKEI